MTFTRESDFEGALVQMLSRKGWEEDILACPDEKALLRQSNGPGLFSAQGRQVRLPVRDEQENPQLPERPDYRRHLMQAIFVFVYDKIQFNRHVLYTYR